MSMSRFHVVLGPSGIHEEQGFSTIVSGLLCFFRRRCRQHLNRQRALGLSQPRLLQRWLSHNRRRMMAGLHLLIDHLLLLFLLFLPLFLSLLVLLVLALLLLVLVLLLVLLAIFVLVWPVSAPAALLLFSVPLLTIAVLVSVTVSVPIAVLVFVSVLLFRLVLAPTLGPRAVGARAAPPVAASAALRARPGSLRAELHPRSETPLASSFPSITALASSLGHKGAVLHLTELHREQTRWVPGGLQGLSEAADVLLEGVFS
mmetsp:Transcript_38483/g.89049  ORF Transcript_38483/g.89049 Transcript_38483/m.89049 type:complete len:259 (+) Transcript_38483:99-875(+)